jgi:hypothetical protein
LAKTHLAQNQIGLIYGELFDGQEIDEWVVEENNEQNNGLIDIRKNYGYLLKLKKRQKD